MLGGQNQPTVAILAAGRGERLSSLGHLKPLYQLDGKSLAQRTLESFQSVGLSKFVIILGYRADDVRRHFQAIASRYDAEVQFVYCDAWERGNGCSALSIREAVVEGDFVISMVDHLFSPKLITSFLKKVQFPEAISLGVDKNISTIFDIPDATKVWEEEGRIRAIDKNLEHWNAIDCGIFYCNPIMFELLESAQVNNDFSLSGGIRSSIALDKAHTVDISGHFWVDVDTPQAEAHAKKCLNDFSQP